MGRPDDKPFLDDLARATRERLLVAARSLLAQTGLRDAAQGAGARASTLAAELAAAGRANAELLDHLVAAEVDRAATRLGLVRVDELDALRDDLARVQRDLIEARWQTSPDASLPDAPAPPVAGARSRPRPTAAPAQPRRRSRTRRPAGHGNGSPVAEGRAGAGR